MQVVAADSDGGNGGTGQGVGRGWCVVEEEWCLLSKLFVVVRVLFSSTNMTT